MSQLGTKKSRKGCVRCKQRRVKCDEEAPCSNCVRRNEECSLLEPAPSGSEAALDPSLPGNTEEWIQDLELMHHWCTSTSEFWWGLREGAQAIWRDYVPQQALKNPFLMHGLLALSALHLAYMNRYSSAHYLQLCDKHQAIALNKFRTILASDIDPAVTDALFALSSVLSVSAMARSCEAAQAEMPQAMSMDSITELLFLTRGIRDVLEVTDDYIRQGPMTKLFDVLKYPEGTEINLPDEVVTQLNGVRHMLQAWGLDEEALMHCQSALVELEEVYQNIVYFADTGNIQTGQVWRWMTDVTTGFVRLVQARCQPALIVFAFFAAATTAVRTAWYTQNWGEYVMRGIALELDENMEEFLEWPRRQIEERMAVLGVQVPEEVEGGKRPIVGFSM